MSVHRDADDLTPAERYAASRRSAKNPVFTDFTAHYDFPLDDFQQRACKEIEAGRGVLVAAPTGSGMARAIRVALAKSPASKRR